MATKNTRIKFLNEYKIPMSMGIRDMARKEKFDDRKLALTAKKRDKAGSRRLLRHDDFWE